MKHTFLGKRFMGAIYAFRGAVSLLKSEASIQVQAVIAIGISLLGWYMEITSIEWMLQTFAIGLVMSLEGANTAIEEIADFIHPDFHHKIGLIKDLAAGAVFFAAITAVIIGGLIYWPYFFGG